MKESMKVFLLTVVWLNHGASCDIRYFTGGLRGHAAVGGSPDGPMVAERIRRGCGGSPVRRLFSAAEMSAGGWMGVWGHHFRGRLQTSSTFLHC